MIHKKSQIEENIFFKFQIMLKVLFLMKSIYISMKGHIWYTYKKLRINFSWHLL